MSITDELRFYVCRLRDEGSIGRACEKNILDTADRIDEEHKREVVKGLNEHQHGRDEGWSEAMGLMEREYVQLPHDADGVPIHIGDEMRADTEPWYSSHRVVGIELRESGRWSIDLLEYGLSSLRPECTHHYRELTTEDLLTELEGMRGDYEDVVTRCAELAAILRKRWKLMEVDE